MEDRPTDTYLTIAAPSQAELKEKHSRFLAFAAPCTDEGAAESMLAALRKEHYTAAHHCSAWRLGADGARFRSSDDGEPSGTAGRRILGAIDRLGLTDTALVVVRYFGGVKLGVGPLAKAYAEAAASALDQARVVERIIEEEFRIRFSFEWTQQAHHALDRAGAAILDRNYDDGPCYRVRIRLSRIPDLHRLLAEFTQRTARVE
ncbi:MAG: YigZ family protein [Ignavibacteriae bacterium]|nr:YigZ family protein [Ignavibacteriota bacterium]